jgi:hypothetical protein
MVPGGDGRLEPRHRVGPDVVLELHLRQVVSGEVVAREAHVERLEEVVHLRGRLDSEAQAQRLRLRRGVAAVDARRGAIPLLRVEVEEEEVVHRGLQSVDDLGRDAMTRDLHEADRAARLVDRGCDHRLLGGRAARRRRISCGIRGCSSC